MHDVLTPSGEPTVITHATRHARSPLPRTEFLRFPSLDETSIGLMPIIDGCEWIPRLARLGVHYLRLRLAMTDEQAVRREIAVAIGLARRHGCLLFVEGHWNVACELGAFGVHADIGAISAPELRYIASRSMRLGLTASGSDEVERSRHVRPSYLELTENMSAEDFRLPMPTIASGHHTPNMVCQLIEAGFAGVAVDDDIFGSSAPEIRVTTWVSRITNLAKQGRGSGADSIQVGA